MKRGKYTIDDIVIGDEILFDDNDTKIEHNLFWKVVSKISPRKILVEIREMGFAEKFIIDIRDIIELQRSGLQLEQIELVALPRKINWIFGSNGCDVYLKVKSKLRK